MNIFRLLIIEDDISMSDLYREKIEVYNELNEDIQFEAEYAESLEKAMNTIDRYNYNGIIADLKLDESDLNKAEGNTIIKSIMSKARVPIVILSGFTADLDQDIEESIFLKVFVKGVEFNSVLDYFKETSENKIFSILGENGIINKQLVELFWDKVINQREYWNESYGLSTEGIDRIISRYILSHLSERLGVNEDGDLEDFHPTEVYINPPIKSKLFTGDIIRDIVEDKHFIVLTPACDIANNKTCDILIAEILQSESEIKGFRSQLEREKRKIIKKEGELREIECGLESNYTVDKVNEMKNIMAAINKSKLKEEMLKRNIRDIVVNNYKLNWHFLPKVNHFDGGIIDFRKINNVELDEINNGKKYERLCSISNEFMKDITARFSQYYSRQGQPNFKLEVLFKDFDINY